MDNDDEVFKTPDLCMRGYLCCAAVDTLGRRDPESDQRALLLSEPDTGKLIRITLTGSDASALVRDLHRLNPDPMVEDLKK